MPAPLNEVRTAGFNVCERTVWRVCRDNGWASVIVRRRGHPATEDLTGAPAHEDLVRR
jgi:putative transposase